MRTPEQVEQGAREHFEKYDAIAKKIGIDRIVPLIPFTRERVAEALQADVYMNNLPLDRWDLMHEPMRRLGVHARAGWGPNGRAWASCETVCTLKHVARYYYVESGKGRAV